jgi:CelD/BcsL family acetyltransferase involved in cellulose biosynthesis
MTTKEITTAGGLEALEPEWSRLWDVCPTATPFQSPEWLIPWWNIFHPGTLKVIVLRENGCLVGLAPLYLGEDHVVRFVGTGNTDHLDALYEPAGAGPGVACAILRHLARPEFAWERCDLLELPADSPLVAAHAPAGLDVRVAPCSVCPVVSLPAAPGGGMRRNIRRYGRRLAEQAESLYEIECGERHGEYLEALYRLHSAAWRERRESGVVSDEQVRRFHRRAAAGFAATGRLRMFGLRHEGALAAVIYSFAAKGRAYLYLSGFAPELSRTSPGLLLLDFALREMAQEGLGEADFLRGDETYKYRWGAQARTNHRLTITWRP